eukprot:168311-Rhodomonas_salina.8
MPCTDMRYGATALFLQSSYALATRYPVLTWVYLYQGADPTGRIKLDFPEFVQLLLDVQAAGVPIWREGRWNLMMMMMMLLLRLRLRLLRLEVVMMMMMMMMMMMRKANSR